MERVVKVVLRGEVAGFVGSMKAASSAAKATVGSLTEGGREAEKYRANLTALGNTAGKIGLVAAGGIALAVRAFANFDEAMSAVAATGEDARGSIEGLRDAAIDAGARTKFSATEAAAAIEALAKAGVSATDILDGGLDGAMDLAAAGGLDVASAAEIAATAMNQFNLVGADVPHIADLLAAAAGKAMGDVSDMGAAFKFVGPVAAQLGVSMEETAGTIALLAQNGVLGEQAGTSLRGMMTSLTSPSKIAADTMKKLGINMYDAQGQFIGLDGLAGQLQSTLGGLEESERNAALGRIFGNEQITAARILYAGGAEDVRKWTAAVDDQGFAAETAATKMDNLKGDLEQLMGSLETALIGTGEGANGPLRELVQLLGGMVDVYNQLPAPIKTTMLAGAGLTAALGGTVFVATRAIDAYAGLRSNLEGVGASFEKANKRALLTRVGFAAAGAGLAALSGPAHEANEALGDVVDTASAAALGFAVAGPWGAAIGGGISLLSAFGGQSAAAAAKQKELEAAGQRVADTLDAQTGALTELTYTTAAKELADAGILKSSKEMGLSLQDTLDAALGNDAALKRATDASEKWADSQAKSGDYTEKSEGKLKTFREGLSAMSKELTDKRASMDLVSEATGGLGDEFGSMATEAEDAAEQIQTLQDALDNLLNPLLTQDQAMVEWKRSIQSLTADLKENGGTLDSNTAKGQDNRDAIRDRAQALIASAKADLDATGNQEAFAKKLERGRKQLIDNGAAAGISKREVRSYIDALGLTPENVQTLIEAQDKATPKINDVKTGLGVLSGITASPRINLRTGGAASAIAGILGGLNALDGKTATSTIIRRTETRNENGGLWEYYAKGGIRENHVAQIASAGTTRVWAEPETGGEAYIPLAPSKRGRSKEIAEQTVALMGGAVAWFANGGIDGVSRLDIKNQERTVRDLERSLREREKFGKKPKKGPDTRPKRNVLRGLDRQIAQLELAEARAELSDMKSGRESRREARQKRIDEVMGERDSVASGLAGGFKLADQIVKNPLGIYRPISGSSIAAGAKAYAAKLKAFASKIEKARKLGIPTTLLQEVAALGVEEGTVGLDALLSSSSGDIATLRTAYRDIDAYAKGAGDVIAKAMDLTAQGRDSAEGWANGFVDGMNKNASKLKGAKENAVNGKKSSPTRGGGSTAYGSQPMYSSPLAGRPLFSTAAATTTTASIVGAEVAVDSDGLMKFVKGQIVMTQDAQAIEMRLS